MICQLKLNHDGYWHSGWESWSIPELGAMAQQSVCVHHRTGGHRHFNAAGLKDCSYPPRAKDLIEVLRCQPQSLFDGKVGTYDVAPFRDGVPVATQERRASETFGGFHGSHAAV